MGSDRVLVVSREVPSRADWQRIDASTPASSLDALQALAGDTDFDSVCAVLADDETISRDDQVALISVLVMRGVRAFETTDPQTVTRILDTHAALSVGQIEVLK